MLCNFLRRIARIFHAGVYSILAQKYDELYLSHHPLTCHMRVSLSVSIALSAPFMLPWQVRLTKIHSHPKKIAWKQILSPWGADALPVSPPWLRRWQFLCFAFCVSMGRLCCNT